MKTPTLQPALSSHPVAAWPKFEAAPATWESGALAPCKESARLSLFRPRRLPLQHPHRQPVW